MDEKTPESNAYNFSSTDSLKKKTIDFIFHLCYLGSQKEENIANHTFETNFTTGVKYGKSLLWKYTPNTIRNIIKELYQYQDREFIKLDNGKLSEEVKDKNKKKIARNTASNVLELLLVVLQHSPYSVEHKKMMIMKDYDKLIKKIRDNKPVNLFSGEMDYDEE